MMMTGGESVSGGEWRECVSLCSATQACRHPPSQDERLTRGLVLMLSVAVLILSDCSLLLLGIVSESGTSADIDCISVCTHTL